MKREEWRVDPYVPPEFPKDGKVPNTRINQTSNADEHLLVKKGDVLKYSGHVTMMYDERESIDSNSIKNYNVINAYGGNYTKIYDGKGFVNVFTRKVIIMNNDVSIKINNPINFGRLIIWE